MATPQTSHIPPLADITPSYGATSSSSTLPLCGSARSDCVALSHAPEPAWRARLHLDQSPSILPASPRAPFKRSRSYSETSSSSARLENLAQPFVVEQLQNLPDPVTTHCLLMLYGHTLAFLRELPDDSRDSQARLLQSIVGIVRLRGLACTYGFNGMTLEQFCAVVRQDDALSAALRVAFESSYGVYPYVLILIVRFVCLRPPNYKSPKSVHFAPEPMVIEADHVEECESSNTGCPSLNSIRPFVVDALEQTPDPFPPLTMMDIAGTVAVEMLHHGKTLDSGLHVLQVILRILLKRELVQAHGLFGLNEAELGDILCQDPLFADVLRRIPFFDRPTFGHDLCFILRHICPLAI